VTDALNEIFDFLTGKIDSLTDIIIEKSILGFLFELYKSMGIILIKLGAEIYNALIKLATSFLTENPKEWMGGSGWETIKGLNDGFVTVGLSLITVFFLIGFYQETVDFKNQIRLEKIIISFTKLSLAQWFVCNSLNLVGALFSLVGDLLPDAVQVANIDITYAKDGINAIKEVTYFSFSVIQTLIIISFVFVGVMAVLGILVLKESFTRFFKVLVMIPYGALASSTIAGTRSMANSAVSFYKYAINCVLEAATMIIALAVYSGTIDGMNRFMTEALALPDIAASTSGDVLLLGVVLYLIIQIILAMVLYSVIKKAPEITKRALGL